MMNQTLRGFTIIMGLLALSPVSAFPYIVGYPKSLDQLTSDSDFIVKAELLSFASTNTASLASVPGFAPRASTLRPISILHDTASTTFTGTTRIAFIHYAEIPEPTGRMYMPLFYNLQVGRTYLIFAKRTDTPGTYIQLWPNHTAIEDQGVLLTADAEPVTSASSLRQVVWSEMEELLKSSNPADVTYSITHLDDLSQLLGDSLFSHTDDFPRADVARAVAPFIESPHEEVATAAIRAVGAESFHLDLGNARLRITNIRENQSETSGSPNGMAQPNRMVAEHFPKLLAVADSRSTPTLRALAIRSLACAERPEISARLPQWIRDDAPEVRQAAAMLLGETTAPLNLALLTELSHDESPQVRIGVADAIIFGQITDLLPILSRLVNDPEAAVRSAAGDSLTSFPPSASEQVLKDNLHHPEFRPMFVNVLAKENPALYLEPLAETIEKSLGQDNFWGGRMPRAEAWDILFVYVKQQPKVKLADGTHDRSLDALERLDWFSSGEPRDLYKFYLESGLESRARKFRQTSGSDDTLNLDYFYDQVDQELRHGTSP